MGWLLRPGAVSVERRSRGSSSDLGSSEPEAFRLEKIVEVEEDDVLEAGNGLVSPCSPVQARGIHDSAVRARDRGRQLEEDVLLCAREEAGGRAAAIQRRKSEHVVRQGCRKWS